MNKIEKFEDIVAWQKARILSQQIYGCSKVGTFARDFGLRDQVQRASVSTMANIAEGFERGGDNEFIQFLSTAKGSCGEVKSHLYVAKDQSYVSEDQFSDLYQQADEVSRLVPDSWAISNNRMCAVTSSNARTKTTLDLKLQTSDFL